MIGVKDKQMFIRTGIPGDGDPIRPSSGHIKQHSPSAPHFLLRQYLGELSCGCYSCFSLVERRTCAVIRCSEVQPKHSPNAGMRTSAGALPYIQSTTTRNAPELLIIVSVGCQHQQPINIKFLGQRCSAILVYDLYHTIRI